MRTYTAHSAAPTETAWALLARPTRWHEWAPHVHGAWGLGYPEVRAGARGAARLLGLVPVPAKITSVVPGRSWTWQVGPVEMVHAVRPDGPGSAISVSLAAPGPLEAAVAAGYGPIVSALVRRLSGVADGEAGLSSDG